MKKITLITLIAVCFLFTASCQEAGTTSKQLTGLEQNLPEELKGLKVYWVWTGKSSGVNVAILDNKINSLTYSEGKSTTSTILLQKEEDNKLIKVKQIIMENDSLIVCRK